MASSLNVVARKIFGSRNDRELKRMRPIVDEINQLEPEIAQRSDDDLRAKIAELKERISAIEDARNATTPSTRPCRRSSRSCARPPSARSASAISTFS